MYRPGGSMAKHAANEADRRLKALAYDKVRKYAHEDIRDKNIKAHENEISAIEEATGKTYDRDSPEARKYAEVMTRMDDYVDELRKEGHSPGTVKYAKDYLDFARHGSVGMPNYQDRAYGTLWKNRHVAASIAKDIRESLESVGAHASMPPYYIPNREYTEKEKALLSALPVGRGVPSWEDIDPYGTRGT